MKKFIILILTLLLTGCGTTPVSKTPLTAVKEIDLTREKIMEISDDFNEYNKDIRIIDINDDYVYLTVHVEFKREHQFYRIDKNNNIESIYTYKYSLWDSNHYIDSNIYNNQIILSVTYPGLQKSQIMKVKDNELETIYEVDGEIYNSKIYDNFLFFTEDIEGDKTDKEYEVKLNYQTIDLNTSDKKTIMSTQLKYDTSTGKVKGNYDKIPMNPGYASGEGFVYELGKTVYYYDFSKDEHIKLFKNDAYSHNTGNDQCVIILKNESLNFVVNEDNQFTGYYVDNNEYGIDISSYNDEYIDDQQYYYSVEGKIPLIIYNYKENILMLYKNDLWYKDGKFIFKNGEIYCLHELEDKIIIEKCTFAKV